MKTSIRELRGSELVLLKNEDTYPNKNLDTMSVTNMVRAGMESIYGIFDDTGLVGSVSVFYRVTLFGMQLTKGTVQLYDLWIKGNDSENHTNASLLLDRVMTELQSKGYEQVLVAMNHISFEQTQILQSVGISKIVGSYKSDFMNGNDVITVFGKVLTENDESTGAASEKVDYQDGEVETN